MSASETRQTAGLDQLVQGLSDTGITREYSSPSLKRPSPGLAAKLGYDDDSTPLVRQSYGETLAKLGYGDAGPSIENVHSIFAAGLQRRRREALNFSSDTKKCDFDVEPPTKRRRFQRRNSKTPAMLFKSMSFLPQDLFTDKETSSNTISAEQGIPRAPQDDDGDWDDGLEIAEELVKHLQKRRLSDVTAH